MCNVLTKAYIETFRKFTLMNFQNIFFLLKITGLRFNNRSIERKKRIFSFLILIGFSERNKMRLTLLYNGYYYYLLLLY